MVNGILLENNVNLPVSISQFYKIIILGLMLFKLSFDPNKINIIIFAFVALFIGSILEEELAGLQVTWVRCHVEGGGVVGVDGVDGVDVDGSHKFGQVLKYSWNNTSYS